MSKRCELQKEYYQVNGNYKGVGKYSDKYVAWLEDCVISSSKDARIAELEKRLEEAEKVIKQEKQLDITIRKTDRKITISDASLNDFIIVEKSKSRELALSICPELAEEIERLKVEWTKRMEDYREQKDKPDLNPILQTKLNTSFLIYRDVLKEIEQLKSK